MIVGSNLILDLKRIRMGIPEKLRQLKAANRYTQAFIGEKIGVHYTTYARWERGETVPILEHLLKLAELYGVDLEFFTGDDSGGRSMRQFPSITNDSESSYKNRPTGTNPTSITITLDGSDSALQAAVQKVTKISRLISDGYL